MTSRRKIWRDVTFFLKSVYNGIESKKYCFVESNDNEIVHHCDICDYKVASKNELDEHVKVYHQTKKCDQCDYKAIDEQEFTNHKNTSHKKLISCEYCKFETENEQTLIVHMKEIHEISCDQCDTKFVTKESLNLHVKFKHLTINTPCVRCKCEVGTKAPSCIDCQENGCKSCVETLNPKSLLDTFKNKKIIDNDLKSDQFLCKSCFKKRCVDRFPNVKF